ncbi:SEL1-like repeat protein [Marinobacterium rhizophilum]|uniref:SEL1-like repeat protein n=1 Tax=Marinobacterium rhizophilum TaxID=420402 RepID=A0ABY5HJ11_9GAMM|nr:SEL1-like repeat protein [Marinobacterium rhizophilum]UTW11583.1 SEL1-like repeat protein [Marinobacterium rhizophilum]
MAYRIAPKPLSLLCAAVLGLAGCSALPLPIGTLPADPEKAEQHYREGLHYTQGVGVTQDYARGMQSFRQAARLGSANAAYMAGMGYLTGRGVAADDASAARWLEVANRDGHIGATFQLGKLYLKGQGVDQDRAWGALLLGLAAANGHSQAMLELAVCYRAGIGVPTDPGLAWYWADQASRIDSNPLIQTVSARLYHDSNAAQRQNASDRAGSAQKRALGLAGATYTQQQLKQQGYNPGPADGLWGPASSRALDAFRNAHALPRGGAPDNADLLRLRALSQ